MERRRGAGGISYHGPAPHRSTSRVEPSRLERSSENRFTTVPSGRSLLVAAAPRTLDVAEIGGSQ
eukprot:2253931-Prymnesium_polylepis.1